MLRSDFVIPNLLVRCFAPHGIYSCFGLTLAYNIYNHMFFMSSLSNCAVVIVCLSCCRRSKRIIPFLGRIHLSHPLVYPKPRALTASLSLPRQPPGFDQFSAYTHLLPVSDDQTPD